MPATVDHIETAWRRLGGKAGRVKRQKPDPCNGLAERARSIREPAMRPSTLLKSFALAATAALTACSANPDQASRTQSPRGDGMFTVEDIRIARKLSLGTASLVQASPEGRAMLCSLGLESIRPQLEQSGVLSGDKRQAFIDVIETFRRKAAAGYGNAAALAEAQRRAEVDYPAASDRARLAMACLRELT